jgi:hypothetical protein
MNDSWVSIALIVYFFAGSAYLLIASKNALVAKVKEQRPSWAEEMCVRFVTAGRIIFVTFTLVYTFFFLKQHLVGTK